jgi:hypothetical protein
MCMFTPILFRIYCENKKRIKFVNNFIANFCNWNMIKTIIYFKNESSYKNNNIVKNFRFWGKPYKVNLESMK